LNRQQQWRNSSNVVLGSFTVTPYTSTTSGWQNYWAWNTAPSGTTNAVVRMVVQNLHATIDVDDLSFTVGSGPTPTSTPAPTNTPAPTAPPLNHTRTHTYDNLGRLTDVQDTLGESFHYTYDLVGNRLSATSNGQTTTQTFDAADQMQGWTYDLNGQLRGDGTHSYSYDALGRMVLAEER
jgi:YD repeat-containing protein